jgi:hypothetical protein
MVSLTRKVRSCIFCMKVESSDVLGQSSHIDAIRGQKLEAAHHWMVGGVEGQS